MGVARRPEPASRSGENEKAKQPVHQVVSTTPSVSLSTLSLFLGCALVSVAVIFVVVPSSRWRLQISAGSQPPVAYLPHLQGDALVDDEKSSL